jgi:hypothetical protein
MKRLLVLLAVLVPLSLLIAGCGQGGGSSKQFTGSKEEMKEQMKMMKAKIEAKMKTEAPPDMPGKGGQK